MNFVDDDSVDIDQCVAHRRREHEIQTLGRCNEKVGWLARKLLTFFRRCVAGAHGNHWFVERNT